MRIVRKIRFFDMAMNELLLTDRQIEDVTKRTAFHTILPEAPETNVERYFVTKQAKMRQKVPTAPPTPTR